MKASSSKYYKLPLFGGLEALNVSHYNSSFPAHYHHTFNITLVYHGVFRAKLNDKLITAPAGSILITNPHEIHANPCEKQSSVSFFTFYLSQDFMGFCNADQSLQFNDKVVYGAGLFRRLHDLSLTIGQGRALQFEEEFITVFSLMAAKHGSSGARDENPRTTRLFEEFLAEENLSKFSLQEAASRFGIDKFKFLRLFKYQTGLTPNNYFILQRIEKSKALLTGRQDLLSIAIDLGFYDAAHFSNHFKKFTGISPGAYIQSL
jgi:AraC-like DNA-binding protein